MAWLLLQCDNRVDAFLLEVGVAAEARLRRDLRTLASKGNALRYPKTDSLGDGLFELRTEVATNIYRNIFIFRGSVIIVLESFQKKTPKTPKRHLDAAKSRRDQIDAGTIFPGEIKPH
ncbi:type II toxin-antitoxin system RelE/ParE family toxin [Sphingomonas sp. JC676]|uniref:type II toxin-antitoxin system RelE/ParE family toxin n=1 Tax=Sphingomonas sp. JC676 TaxID=2768065 RepID=UPI001657BB62|nr:type II toxin-antitoxin system RelE/ParE family toxin [Sphingomonas sp. JC676]MBC9034312.1 type II toxin-antitoxin system RelE/ParE family toxin [Sphingomonas sp. JC676]